MVNETKSYKLKSGLFIRNVAGEKVLLPSGQSRVDFSKMLVLNESAALLIEAMMKEEPMNVNDLISLLSEHYDVKPDRAQKDVLELIGNLLHLDMLEL